MRRMAQPLVARRTLALILLVLLTSLAPPDDHSNAQPAQTVRIVVTVRAVDSKTRTCEVLTGVGHAVRVLRLQVAEDCRVTVPWAAAHISSFVPGTNALIEYVPAPATAHTPPHGVLTAIEAIDIERTKGAP